MRTPRTVAVLGAGTMGAQIAAHVANAGVACLLLDVTPDAAREGLERARRTKPDPFFTADTHQLIRTGGFDQLHEIAACDWILEAVVERLDVKHSLLARVEAARRPGTIVTTNTSGLPIAAVAAGRSEEFRRHFLGTHFFNPPRYMRLLELIPTPDTDPEVMRGVAQFADHRLGKGIVVAKDAPNFIANRIGIHGALRILEEVAAGRYTIEEVDAMTGPALGRPGSATFRTLDLAGIDVLSLVAANLVERLASDAERARFVVPAFVHDMLARGWMGDKAGQGFYKRVKTPRGIRLQADSSTRESEILVLDPGSLEYRPKQPVRLPALDAARAIEDPRARIRALFNGQDRVGEFLRRTLGATLIYTAQVTPEIAYSPEDVDRAMRWGFGWEVGPFEISDAIGASAVLATMPPDEPSYRWDQASAWLGSASSAVSSNPPEGGRHKDVGAGLEILRSAKERSPIVKRNAGASLVDLGDGVLAVEFHSKMNTIGGDAIEMLRAGVDEASRNFTALVVGNEAPNFSAGANLMLLLLEAQEGNWDEIDLMVRAFQSTTGALRYADVPVVAAPAGLALAGGCEILLHADRVQAAAETYTGLVEVGVGLVPAGGGTKEVVARSADIQRAFETIALASVSTSAPDARRLGYLREIDGITPNRDRVMADAKTRALARVREGYQRPARRTAIPVGGEGLLATLQLGIHIAWRSGRASDHDALVARKLAWIMAGGALPHRAEVSEQYLLDLEREAFLSLCGERKTLERIQHTLKTGKPLRN